MSAACRSLDKDQLPPSYPTRSRARFARTPPIPVAGGAANDESAQSARAEGAGLHGFPRLDEIIRDVVRREVRAEVARMVAMAPASPKFVTVAEYAAARSISASTVRNAIRSGRLPAIRYGSAVRVPADVELGRPVAVNANRRASSPVERAEQIVAARSTRSLSSGVGDVAA